MSRYEMILYWSDEDHPYGVQALELRGCMVGGPTHREAVACAEKVVEGWASPGEEDE